jgi:hypothetical protein
MLFHLFIFVFTHFKLFYLGIMCANICSMSCFHTFDVPLEDVKDLLFGDKNMQGNFKQFFI